MRHLESTTVLRAALALWAVSCGGPVPSELKATCGDGRVQAGEECDDGNADNADGCLSSCYAATRWISGDPHIHGRGCDTGPFPPEHLRANLAARGLRVGAALVWGDGYGDLPLFTGNDHPGSAGDPILHYDLEVSAFPAGQTGHLLLLGLRSIDFSPDPFRSPASGVPVVEWARAQGPRVLVGMAHSQFWPTDESFPVPPVECCMPWDLAVHASRGRLDFLSTERRAEGEFRPGDPVDEVTLKLWSRLLGAGFRVPLAGASDYPCVTHVIEPRTLRTDVAVDGAEVTYERWLEGIRRGRTAVGDGVPDRLHLRVNGVPVGGEARAAAGERLSVWVESVLAQPSDVEIRANARPVATVRVPSGSQATRLDISLPRSAWVIAVAPHVLTSPVYVVIDGRPVRIAEDACYLMRYVDHLKALVTSRRLDLQGDAPAALAAYDEARAELQQRFRDAGGDVCR